MSNYRYLVLLLSSSCTTQVHGNLTDGEKSNTISPVRLPWTCVVHDDKKEDGANCHLTKYSVHYDGDEEPSQYYTKDGKAKVTYANGDTFAGELVDAEKHGSGEYVWKELKASYNGEWNKGTRCGHGKFSYPDGSKYEGGWDGDKRNGKGTLIYANGDSYCGEWVDGQREGQGIYSYNKDRSQLIGEWKGDKFVSGKWRYNDKTEYVGSFDHNIPTGKGTFSFSSGNQNHGVYENGSWKSQSTVLNV